MQRDNMAGGRMADGFAFMEEQYIIFYIRTPR
jgi:hypothetical protein